MRFLFSIGISLVLSLVLTAILYFITGGGLFLLLGFIPFLFSGTWSRYYTGNDDKLR
jgi:hypothetical protein